MMFYANSQLYMSLLTIKYSVNIFILQWPLESPDSPGLT